MATSEASAEVDGTHSSAARTALSVAVGVIVGASVYYAVAVTMSAQIPGNFTVNPVALVAIAVVGAVAVFVGWRWPAVGVTAGVFILLVVVFAVAGRVAWSSSGTDWLNPFNAVAFGAASGYPTLAGAMLLTVSTLRLRVTRSSR